MPNFSHGTAGVAYFLARLHEVTGDDAFLAPAVQGGRYLEKVSACDARSDCLVFHHEPGGEELYYLGWCHGPVGTARLFVQLARVAGGGEEWMKWVGRGAEGIRAGGIPETRTEGFWNNVSQCCGDAGVGDFFLSLHASGADPGALAFARRLGSYLREQATEEVGQARWVQAENRTQPENVMAQTGWMQGAAGVGAFFLHLDGIDKGRTARVVFPDSPWRGFI
jgi:lantibiotic modifying enzyme